MTLTDFYQGKRVLITGHTGFKGAWLAVWLKRLGAQVAGFALAPSGDRPSLFGAAAVAEGMVSTLGDVRDLELLRQVMTDQQPEMVFHLAAQAFVRRSYRMPIETLSTNVMGTANLLEAARGTPSVRAIIDVTTDKVYEERPQLTSFREDDPLGGHDPYSASKACVEMIVSAYRRSFYSEENGPQLATARAGNVLGGGDWGEDRLVPDFVCSLVEDRPVVLRRPHAVRPWQHVLEPLSGYLLLGQKLIEVGPPFAQAWNFGPPEDSHETVEQLSVRLIDTWGQGRTQVDESVDPHLHEARYLALDWTKAKDRLGWSPKLSLDETIRLTAQWYQAYRTNPTSAARLTEQQIDDYMRRGVAEDAP